LFNWLSNKLSNTHTPPYVIFIDIDLPCYQLCEALVQQHLAQPAAFIDEEPWSHLTIMQGAKLHYPNELIALCQKHQVQIVIKFTGFGWEPNATTIEHLTTLNIVLLTLNPQDHLEQQLAAVKALLK